MCGSHVEPFAHLVFAGRPFSWSLSLEDSVAQVAPVFTIRAGAFNIGLCVDWTHRVPPAVIKLPFAAFEFLAWVLYPPRWNMNVSLSRW